MSTKSGRSVFHNPWFVAGVAVVTVIVAAGAYSARARASASLASPRVTSIIQVTHDGFRKTNLLADDTQLYVTELPASQRVIAKVSLPQSDRSLVSSPFSNPQALDLSPDHTNLLVAPVQSGVTDDEFWTLPVAVGSPKRIGNLSGRDAAWSADGQHLVFTRGSVLYLAGASGKDVHDLYTASGSVFGPHFSPDGTRVRFTVGDTAQNTTALWEVNQDGSNPHALLAGWQYAASACCGNWTADGRYYIFQALQNQPNTSTTFTALWALAEPSPSPDNNISRLVRLTNAPMSFGNASPGRDTKKMWAIGVAPAAEIVKYDRRHQKFIPVIPGVSATDLAYSNDGKWVSYVAIPEGTLWRSRANGTDRLQLTEPAEQAALPVWSPDGKQIAFVSLKPGESWKLYLVSATGGTLQEVLSETGSQIDANWSADGSRIMFGDFNHDLGGLSIRILDLKTHKLEKVPGSDGLFSPRWSPDGRYIAALSPDNTTLRRFDFQTQTWSNWLVESAGTVSYPVWSADSKYLYFDDLVNGDESIRKVKVGDSQPELAFVLGALDRYPGALGTWSGRAADGSWMFVRDHSTQEVYQLNLDLP